MNIGILGLPRTGTSATYQFLKAALPAETQCYFEPVEEPPLVDGQSMLCKMLVAPLPGTVGPSPAWIASLDRCIILHRDPRDRLISTLLFMLHWHNEQYPPLWQRDGFEGIMAFLEEKEQTPSLPVWHLFEWAYAVRFGMQPGAACGWLAAQQAQLLHYATLCPEWTIQMPYENLLKSTRNSGMAIPRDPARQSIKREETTGAWRHWFTPEDCTYFAATFAPYCDRMGYLATTPVALAQHPVIDPATSSRYVKKWVRVYRRSLQHATP